jgi:hypothetical protein
MTHSGPQTSGLQPSGLQTASLPATITSGGGAVRRAPPPPLRWRHWPIEEGGPSAWLLSLVMLGATGMVGWETGSATWALAACGLVAAAAWRYFVPVYYELNAQGIFQEVLGRRRRITWRSVGRAEVCRDGVFLARGAGLLATMRGLYLPWGRYRAEVVGLVAYYLRQFEAIELARGGPA